MWTCRRGGRTDALEGTGAGGAWHGEMHRSEL